MKLLTHDPEEQLSAKAKAFLARPKKLYINFDSNLRFGGFKEPGWGRELSALGRVG